MLKLSSRGLQFLDSWNRGLSGLIGTSVMVPMVAVPRERSVPTLDTPRPAPYSPQTRLSGSRYQAEPLRTVAEIGMMWAQREEAEKWLQPLEARRGEKVLP